MLTKSSPQNPLNWRTLIFSRGATDEVRAGHLQPLVADVFTLDVMTEMLSSPLHFLSYVNRRTGYYDRLLARDELTLLSWHLKRNLWIEEKYHFVMVDDDISADLDVAMAVRRDEVPGKSTPDGILTRVAETVLSRVVTQIGSMADARTIDLGFMLLRLSERAMRDVSSGIEAIARKARHDGKSHDLTVLLTEAKAGLTVHCNDEPVPEASRRLRGHCRLRKYMQKSRNWFGICVSPADTSVRFGLNLDYEWEQDARMDAMAANFSTGRSSGERTRAGGKRGGKRRIGRNEPCPCGSGKKYKRCHGR